MKIILKSITLLNFKGCVGERTIDFNPTCTYIYGANRSGKTTVADAFRWCLFGKNSEGATNFGIEPRGTKVVDHIVKVTMEADGRPIELKRNYVSKYSKDEQKRVVGHTTMYYVNGEKYTEADYKEYIASLCSEQLFMAVTNPTYFPHLPADQQRALLTKMVGGENLGKLAEDNEKFADLLEELQGTTLERYLEHLNNLKREIEGELERIPIRISEQEKELTQYQEYNWEELEQEKAGIDAAIKRIDEELADRSKLVDARYSELKKRRDSINQVKQQIEEAEAEHQRSYRQRKADIELEQENTRRNYDKAERAIVQAQEDIQQGNKIIENAAIKQEQLEQRTNALKEDFRTRWAEAQTATFNYNPEDSRFICPTCGRKLEAEDIDAEIDKMRSNWNAAHAKQMADLKAEADRIIKEHDKAAEDINKEVKRAQELITAANIKDLEQQRDDAKLLYEKAMAQTTVSAETIIDNDVVISTQKSKLARMEQQLKELEEQDPGAADQQPTSLQADKKQLMEKRDAVVVKINSKETIERKRKRIKELEEQEHTLNQQKIALVGKQDVAEDYMQLCIEDLEERVNKLFNFVKFEMFERKLNNSLKPKCECLCNGVPYSDANSADKVNAGIDIINAICKFNDIYAPCFIDNAESINDVLEMQSQAVHLIVSRDKALEIR